MLQRLHSKSPRGGFVNTSLTVAGLLVAFRSPNSTAEFADQSTMAASWEKCTPDFIALMVRQNLTVTGGSRVGSHRDL